MDGRQNLGVGKCQLNDRTVVVFCQAVFGGNLRIAAMRRRLPLPSRRTWKS
jgi:hypothetical protein